MMEKTITAKKKQAPTKNTRCLYCRLENGADKEFRIVLFDSKSDSFEDLERSVQIKLGILEKRTPAAGGEGNKLKFLTGTNPESPDSRVIVTELKEVLFIGDSKHFEYAVKGGVSQQKAAQDEVQVPYGIKELKNKEEQEKDKDSKSAKESNEKESKSEEESKVELKEELKESNVRESNEKESNEGKSNEQASEEANEEEANEEEEEASQEEPVVPVIGGKYFLLHEKDNIEYPVTIVRPSQRTLHQGTCFVKWLGYRTKKAQAISVNQLLPYTEKRVADFNACKEKTKKEIMAKQEQNRRKANKRKAKMQQVLQAKEEERKRARAMEIAKYEPRTDSSGLRELFEDTNNTEGYVLEQKNRLVVFAYGDDTVLAIAKKFKVDADKILYDNKKVIDGLTKGGRLIERTPVILPLAWNGRLTIENRIAPVVVEPVLS